SCDLLGRATYHVVVGNPPYITVKDRLENQAYRDRYGSCSGAYALSVPFAERMFQLAVRTDGSDRAAGVVGQITANSFMKREFGKKLIEQFLPTVHLTHVIDTSGAYIPGHGTPTVILVGRNHWGRKDDPIRAVLGTRGEPNQPSDPARGLVWTAITEQIGQTGSESEWVTVEDADRQAFSLFPWSVSGGGAGDLRADIEQGAPARLSSVVGDIGAGAVTREDSVYMVGSGAARRAGVAPAQVLPLVEGETVRDFSIGDAVGSVWPYDRTALSSFSSPAIEKWLWPYRVGLSERVAFGKSQLERGLDWFEYSMFFADRFREPLSIAFAFVATHNQFVLDRGGKVFIRTAPVIKLPAGASEDDHLALLGVLNSSAACFWLKQVCHDKGSQSGTGGFMQDEWERFYEFTGTKLQEFPLPADLPLDLGRDLDRLAQLLAAEEPAAVCARITPTMDHLGAARTEHEQLRRRMIALQEELDWQVYGSYALITETETKNLLADSWVEPLALGERAFEIVLARKVKAGEMESAWFDRHGSTPITEIPSRWSPEYQKIVQARIDIIENRRDIALIERPECKRRWASPTWEK
ncbi:MAG: BREX-2 system adenine-specific DNA-methyltransferase PglX, partial [Cryobacterium sp.]|nr:BREX-2 system adenine-specific DNA-methyltransferase PglX [Cryobacterium sp.]